MVFLSTPLPQQHAEELQGQTTGVCPGRSTTPGGEQQADAAQDTATSSDQASNPSLAGQGGHHQVSRSTGGSCCRSCLNPPPSHFIRSRVARHLQLLLRASSPTTSSARMDLPVAFSPPALEKVSNLITVFVLCGLVITLAWPLSVTTPAPKQWARPSSSSPWMCNFAPCW